MKETDIVRQVQMAASKLGGRLFRTNAGMAWAGKSRRLPDGSVIIPHARPFHGVPEGHPDTVGFVPVTITPEMVGQTFARVIYIEVKTEKGRVSDGQRTFIDMVRRMGGLAGVARSPSDVGLIAQGRVLD